MPDFNISSAANTAIYNTQATTKVATMDNGNLANRAANQSAFTSYISQALAQIGVANPTAVLAPVISGTSKANAKGQDSQKSVSNFIQDLFSILGDKETKQLPATAKQQTKSQSATLTSDFAIASYSSEESAAVDHIVSNLQALVNQFETAEREGTGHLGEMAVLNHSFQQILDAQGAGAKNKITLGSFLNALAQNLQGKSPLGIILDAKA